MRRLTHSVGASGQATDIARLLFVTFRIHTQGEAINELQFKGEWNALKGKLKQKYAQLTDDDLMYAKGKEDELLGRLQKKLGQKEDEVRKLLAEL